MRRLVATAALMVLCLFTRTVQAQVIINCPSGFTSTSGHPCTVEPIGGSGQAWQFVGAGSPSISGTQALLIPTGESHYPTALDYQTKVNDQAFTTTFTFTPNGQNVSFF